MPPDSPGNFTQDFSALEHIIKRAHRNKVKVLFTIGGGDSTPYSRTLLHDKSPMHVQNFLILVLRYNLDRIDVDIEKSDIDNNYEALVVEPASSLRLHQKLINVAVPFPYLIDVERSSQSGLKLRSDSKEGNAVIQISLNFCTVKINHLVKDNLS